MAQEFSKKQIKEAIEFWTKQLNESKEDIAEAEEVEEAAMTPEEFFANEEEKIEETAPGSGKYEPNTVGAVIELLKKSDPNDILFIRDAKDKSSKIITDIERKITMKAGVTYMEIAPGDPMQA